MRIIHDQVIHLLNESLKHQLVVANQYAIHAQRYQYHRLDKLYRHQKQEQADRNAASQRLANRILSLNGKPVQHVNAKLYIGNDPMQMLRYDLRTERLSIQQLQASIAGCRDCSDRESTDLLLEILDETDDQISWLENQLELLAKIGEENYLRIQMPAGEGKPMSEDHHSPPQRRMQPLVSVC